MNLEDVKKEQFIHLTITEIDKVINNVTEKANEEKLFVAPLLISSCVAILAKIINTCDEMGLQNSEAIAIAAIRKTTKALRNQK